MDFLIETEDGYSSAPLPTYDPKSQVVTHGDKTVPLDKEMVAQLLQQQAKEIGNIEELKIQEEQEILYTKTVEYENMLKKRINIFSDDFEMTIPERTFLLVGAATGHGKSTFAQQVAAHAVAKGRRVLIISNELPAEAYYSAITAKYISMTHQPHRMAFNRIFELMKVEDVITSRGMTAGWMTCVQYIFNKIKEYKPDIVLFDQLSNATLDIGYDKKERVPEYKKYELMAADIQSRIHSKEKSYIPPIITFQQMMPSVGKPIGWNMQATLRGSKNTLTCATHGIMIVKKRATDGGYLTVIKIDKTRYNYNHGPIISTWTMDNNWVLTKCADQSNE